VWHALRAALRDVPVSSRGYPLTIDPEWFEGTLPWNDLLGPSQPWLELAHQDQKDLVHPPDPFVIERTQAGFWYNPHTGHVRARVPAQASESASVELYNRVNGRPCGRGRKAARAAML
jgi:hypothetical protein